jgi:hypothetical protein
LANWGKILTGAAAVVGGVATTATGVFTIVVGATEFAAGPETFGLGFLVGAHTIGLGVGLVEVGTLGIYYGGKLFLEGLHDEPRDAACQK